MKILESLAIITIFMVTAFNTLSAQDIIVKADGTLLKGKVEEITETSIKYRKADNPTGPLYNVNKSEVLTINYENGTIDVINQQGDNYASPVFSNRPQRTNNAQTYRSTFSVGYSRLNQTVSDGEKGGLNGLSLEYETLAKPKLGVRVPIYLHFQDGLRVISGGVNPKFYLTNSQAFKVFAGPEFIGGYVNEADFGFLLLLGSFGISYNVTPTFNMSAYSGFGYMLAFDGSGSDSFFANNIGVKMGINF